MLNGGITLSYFEKTALELKKIKTDLENEYKKIKSNPVKLDMSRGKPSQEQVDLSRGLLDTLKSDDVLKTESGVDCANYGALDGIPECKKLFSKLLGVSEKNIFIGGNSSLSLMFDAISCFMMNGVLGYTPWSKLEKVKFLCPCPGYDRHFAILDYFNIEPIIVPMTSSGPDMDMVERLVMEDESIKGIWCVPKYSNPQGITYSDETVIRFSKLRPKAKDFRVFWDNAYAIHDICDQSDTLLNLMDECVKNSNANLPLLFCSTSKITFPGGGVSAVGSSSENISQLKEMYYFKTISYDKLNQLRHVKYFESFDKLLDHMQKHKKILKPKFDLVLEKLRSNFENNKIVSWTEPKGGYFISLDVKRNCAKRVVNLCKDAGLSLTPAGSTFPKKIDPNDSNIRLAPSYPTLSELSRSMDLLCLCVKLATVEEMLKEKMNSV